MTALLSSELLKLRTTRASIGLVLALLLISAAAAAAFAASADLPPVFDPGYQEELPIAAAFATLFALLFGIVVITAEYRHGTITPTFLVTPARRLVIGVKGLASAIGGVVLAVLSLALVYAIAVPWLALRGAELDLFAGRAPGLMLGVVVSAALYGAFGVGVGAIVRNQVAAIVGVLAWFLILEPIVGLLLDSVAPYLPGAAGDALAPTSDDPNSDRLSAWGGFALLAAYAGVALVLGAIVTERRDVG